MYTLVNFTFLTVEFMAVVLATLSFTLFFLRSEAFTNNKMLKISRNQLALGLLVIAVNCGLHGLYGWRSTAPSVAIAFDITSYFLMAILLTFAYVPLLDPSFATVKRKLLFLSQWLVCSICLWIAALFTYDVTSMVLIGIGATFFFLSVFRIFMAYIRRYRNVSNILTENTIDNVENFTSFLYGSVIIMAVTGILASVACMWGNEDVQNYFNLFATLMFFKLTISFINYVTSLGRHNH